MVEEGDRIGSLLAISTPGHIHGHLAYLDERDGTLYAGDELFGLSHLGITGRPPWWFPMKAYSNLAQARETAIKLLTDFKQDAKNSWLILTALKTLARLQEDAGRTDDARKTYEELADLPDVPKELKQESEVLVGRLFLRVLTRLPAPNERAGLVSYLREGYSARVVEPPTKKIR